MPKDMEALVGDTYADASSPEAHTALPDCAGGESFALMVLGHSMAPEFNEGEIIVIEPDGLAQGGLICSGVEPGRVDLQATPAVWRRVGTASTEP
jgi:hypothetical protein